MNSCRRLGMFLAVTAIELRTHSTQGIPSMLEKYKGRLVADAELNFLGKSTGAFKTIAARTGLTASLSKDGQLLVSASE